MVGAVVASRQLRPETALASMRRVQEVADRLGEDRGKFGPTNVALHAVAVAVELGDAGQRFAELLPSAHPGSSQSAVPASWST